MLVPVITPRDNGLDVAAFGQHVLVNTARHTFDVVTTEGVRWEIGASRVGVQTVLNLVEDCFAPERLLLEDRTAISNAITVALRKAAARAGMRAAKTERQIDAIQPTPLVYAPEFMRSPYLREDAEKFRPARVAIALLEDDSFEDATPEGAEALVSVLERWRDIYGQAGSAKKAINKTLSQYGEELSVEALWGLRRVRLSRVAQSLSHAEVLGTIGAHSRYGQLAVLLPIIEVAAEEELATCMHAVVRSRLVPGTSTNALAEVLLALGGHGGTKSLTHLVERALDSLRDRLTGDTKTALPPIPLPARTSGIRFLANAREVVEEGEHMDHCVATRFWDAFEGRAYLFHVTTQFGDVTVQMNPDGTVYEARGPCNAYHPGVAVATAALQRWGQGIAFGGIEANASTWRGGPEVPRGQTALRRVSDCVDLHSRVCDRILQSDRETWNRWFLTRVERAVVGVAWLVWSLVDTMPVVSVLNDRGRVIEQSRSVLESGNYRGGKRR